MKARTISIIMLMLTSTTLVICQTSDKKETLTIPIGKIGLIGYGSLMSKASTEMTLGHPYTDKFLPVHVNGFERIWNFAMPNDGSDKRGLFYFIMAGDTVFPKRVISLSIEENRLKSINAMLFLVDSAELKMLDAREYGYTRINVTDKINEFNVVGGSVYAYKALPAFTIRVTENPRDNVISKGYIKVVEEDALLSRGEQFRDEYYATTLPYSPKILMTRSTKPLKK
jgi:hypothetical protein